MMEENKENVELQSATDKLKSDTDELVLDILKNDNSVEIKDLIQLFNLAQLKKQVVRSAAYNTIMDNVTAQIEERVKNNADCFSNKDLIDYVKTISDSLEKTQKQIADVDTSPSITINQQNNTVVLGKEELSRESREKVLDAINAFLNRIQNQQTDTNNELKEEFIEDEEESSEEIEKLPIKLEEEENHAE